MTISCAPPAFSMFLRLWSTFAVEHSATILMVVVADSDGTGKSGFTLPLERDFPVLGSQSCCLYHASQRIVLPRTYCRGKIFYCRLVIDQHVMVNIPTVKYVKWNSNGFIPTNVVLSEQVIRKPYLCHVEICLPLFVSRRTYWRRDLSRSVAPDSV